jgi:hypothetical protein
LTAAGEGGGVGDGPTPATGPAEPSPDEALPREFAGGDAAPRVRPFSLEGRAAPGLYLVGWLACLVGGGLLFVSFNATATAAAPWLFLVALAFLAVGLVGAAGSQAIERSRRPDLAYRGPSPVLVFLLVVVLTLGALIVVLGPLSGLGLDARSPLATTLNLALTTALYIGAIRLLVVGTGALSWREMGVVRPTRAAVADLVAGAVLALPVLVATLALGGILSRFLAPAPSVLPPAADAAALAANLLSAAVLAPIGEELFFRGFATTAWARAAGPSAAIARGAVFFAVAHVVTLVDVSFAEGAQRALFSFLALLPVGVALGWLYLGRRSLYAAIGLHAAFNAVQVVLLAIAGGAATP